MNHDEGLNPLISWAGRTYPPSVERLRDRLRRSGVWDRIDVGRGWWPLLVRLDERLVQVVDWYGASCIREVDGLLRFDASSSPDTVEFTDLVLGAMFEASRTCSVCGRPGVRRRADAGRHFTRCEEHARPLYDEERGFLAQAGIPSPAVSEIEFVPLSVTHAAVSAMFEASVTRTHLAAEDIAAVLGMSTDEVYQLYLRGELVGARGDDAEVVYPRWQLHEGARIPGLAEVTFRVHYAWNAMDARSVMLRPTEELSGLSPVEWLVGGYPVSAVTALLLSYEYEGMPDPATADDSDVVPGDGDAGDEGDGMGFVERVWREVRERLEDLLGPTELAAALSAYAADRQDRLRLADVRRIRAEYGRSYDPSAETLVLLLHSRGRGR